jgi:hypothetical protein
MPWPRCAIRLKRSKPARANLGNLIDNPDDRIGDTWGMRVESFTHRRLDLDAALMRLGLDLLEPYLVEKEFAVVRLARVREEERKTHAINPEV